MKAWFGWVLLVVLAAAAVQAQDVPAQTPAQQAAQAAAARVLAIADNNAAADALVAEIRAMMADPQAVKDGVPELTIAALVKTDIQRAMQILPRALNLLSKVVTLDLFQRLVASALTAAGDGATALTQAIMAGLANNPRFLDAVMVVAQDTGAPLPVGLRMAILTISATVLPPAVIPPGPYDGQ